MRKARLKIEAFTPSAARGTTPRRPTKAVSTNETRGSAANVPSAGTASPKISRSKGCVRREADRNRAIRPGISGTYSSPTHSVHPLLIVPTDQLTPCRLTPCDELVIGDIVEELSWQAPSRIEL